ncbi:MAG: CHAT domain-containing protein [Egibacteraceae bacterium]
MPKYADLEIGLHHRTGKTWSVEFRFHHPDSVAEQVLQQGDLRVRFDLERLERHMFDPDAYGRALTRSLFIPPVKEAFEKARSLAQSDDLGLRVRLLIGPSAPELHGVRWETLRDPRDGTALLMDESIVFSRYLSSLDWRPVGVRPRSDLRALVVVANPSDLAEYEAQGRALPPIDVEGEVDRIQRAMGWLHVTPLASGGAATLAGILDGLRSGHDILYLVCHGYLVEGETQILLEDPAGGAHRVSGGELIDALRDLARPPRLVVLASCQSAGAGGESSSSDNPRPVVLASRQSAAGGEASSSDDRGVLASLGPRMAEAGVPAVLAMQGRVSMRTVSEFMPVFFGELKASGQIDRAMTLARRAVKDRHDWWVPVLFMRLKTGRFWYAPGFAGGRDFEQWPGLLAQIRRGRCTPVLGPGLMDGYIGSRQEIAQGWASQYHFPMARHHREDLPHVAQYLAVNQSYEFPRYELESYLHMELLERYAGNLPAGAHTQSLNELMLAAGAYRRSVDPNEPYAALARLPFKMFITTQPTSLLADALIAEGKEPRVELCRWKDDADWPPSVFDDTSAYEPSPQRPLVYHLFGHLAQPDTLVITEDDYFDYLIGVTKNKELIPETVRHALADSALLFLGFRLDEWDFAVLFRSILNQEGGRRRSRYLHVAAQIDPEESRTIDPDRARRYLESYFSQGDQFQVSIYWGSVDDFARQLSQHWNQR